MKKTFPFSYLPLTQFQQQSWQITKWIHSRKISIFIFTIHKLSTTKLANYKMDTFLERKHIHVHICHSSTLMNVEANFKMEMFFEHFHFHICHLFIENNLHNIRILQKSFNMLHLTKELGERVCNARWVHMACPACFPPSASSRRCRSQEGQLELVASQKQAKPRYSPFLKKSCTHIKYYLVKLNCNCFNKLPHSQRIGAYRNGKKSKKQPSQIPCSKEAMEGAWKVHHRCKCPRSGFVEVEGKRKAQIDPVGIAAKHHLEPIANLPD